MSRDREQKRKQRLQAFRGLVQERVTKMSASWVELELDISNRSVSNELMGELHTLKGESGLLGFAIVSDLAHALEDVISGLLLVGEAPDMDVGDHIMNAFDALLSLSEREPDNPALEGLQLITQLQQIADSQPAPEPSEPKQVASQSPGSIQPGQQLSRDALQQLPPSAIPNQSLLEDLRDETSVAIPIPIPSDSPRKLTGYSVRVNPKQLDQIRDIIGELLLTRTRLAGSATSLHEQRQGVFAHDAHNRDEILRSIESELRDDVVRMSTLVNALDEVTRDLRMVPISVIFDQYPIAVRSLSRSLGKRVQLVCEGETVEADRDVLEALNDSLIHLVRNAVDHGIEAPEMREKLGKTPFGTIILTANVTGDTLHLELRDDGSGIDVESVRRKAVERGLIDPGAARNMSPKQVLRSLFESGMSTREKVGKTSGRGVGLDVVLQTARNLGGSVDLSSMLGGGTTFRISVPIRASITSVMLFRVGQGRYALPTNSLVAVVDMDDYQQVESIDGPALQYEEGLLPLIDLERVLDEPKRPPTEDDKRRVIITRHGSLLIGLDGSYNHLQREAVLKPVGNMLRDDKLISAGLALEDGSVALVLNPSEVFRAVRGQQAPQGEDAMARILSSRATNAERAVLVAEDSPIVRDLVVEALRIHGLTVLEAVDGQHALEQLESHPEIQLLVTDIEMPRLNGLGLIKRMRARGGRRIPAVVVSTRGSDADKLAAMEVGADAYLVKSDFSREGLWSLVSRFLG